MQSHYPAQFVREMGCTLEEWLKWLPRACEPHAWTHDGASACVVFANDLSGQGRLNLAWQVLPERRIALMRIPRLQVHFAFEGLEDAQRTRFMRHFDLLTQRGGG